MSAAFTERLPLSRSRIDRDHLSRSRPELFDELTRSGSAKVVVLHRGAALLADDGMLALPLLGDAPRSGLMLYLGRSHDDGSAFVASVLSDDEAAALGGDARWGSLRELGSQLSDLEAGLFTQALALANWHGSHAFSPRTGAETRAEQSGWTRRGEGDDHELFPRTDAAVIVGVTDADDRLLLGSNALWAPDRYSLLAGFVEPGESLEAAVVREVFEESGVHVVDPVYLGSQPWPFPASLMVGFRATVDPERVTGLAPDGEEIVDLRWFKRAELAASLDQIALPGATSIARAIIEDWFGGPIDDHVEW
jgi:NAD+ diphosphatase